MARPRPLRILIVDDHDIVRRGLTSVLSRRENFQVVGEAGTAAEAVRKAQELLDAIQRVGEGQSLLDPAVTAKVLEQVRGPRAEDAVWAQLLPQERQILELIADGKTNKEIAEEVFLSDRTVKNYVSSILSKLDMARRSQAAAYLAERRARRGSSL